METKSNNRQLPTRRSGIAKAALVMVLFVSGCGGDSHDDESPGRRISGKGEACMGLLGLQCEAGLYCDVEDFSCGAADQTGICKEVPQVCSTVFEPVCGCDDQTYGNACTAAASGVSLSAIGACKS